MDRILVAPYQIPTDLMFLNTNKNAMVALGYALQAILGGSTLADGLSCSATSPATMTVNVATGSIYQLEQIDATAYGNIAADTVNQIVKQGIVLGTTNFSCPAPATAGQSVVYLIQAQFQEEDTDPENVQYYNAEDPAEPVTNNVNTMRQGVCVLNRKTGTPATTGSQVAPAPDAGYTALWAITVANGQTTITSGNIAPLGPFIGTKLTGKLNSSYNLADVASAATALANIGGAPIVSPHFFGAPQAPTPGQGDNTTALATTAFVQGEFSGQLLSFTGYQVLPGASNSRMIIQWMQVSLNASVGPSNGFYGGQDSFTFPMTFPNNCLLCVAAPINTAGVEGGAAISNPSTTGVAVAVQNTQSGSSPANVIAIGY